MKKDSKLFAQKILFMEEHMQLYPLVVKSKLTEGFEPVLNGFKQVAFNDSKAVSRNIDKETAAIMIETVQGEGGITLQKKNI